MITTVQSAMKIVIQQHEWAVQKEQKEQATFTPYWKFPIFDDDDDEYTIQYKEYLENSSNAITPDLSSEEPDNSISMGDEHLNIKHALKEKHITVDIQGHCFINFLKMSKLYVRSGHGLYYTRTELFLPSTDNYDEDDGRRSSVEGTCLVQVSLGGFSDSMCDVPFCENSHPLDALKDHYEIFFDPNDDYASSDDDPLYSEDIDYVDASPPDSELVSLEEVKDFDIEDGEIDTDILLTIKDEFLHEKLLNINLLIAKIEALKDNPTPSTDSVLKSPSSFPNSFLEETDTSDNSLPEFDIFCFDMEEKTIGNPTSHFDLSLPDYEAFYHDNEPDLENFTIDVVEDIFDNPTRELYVHVPNVFPTHLTLYLDSDFAPSDDSSDPILIALDYEASRARGFVLRSLELHSLASMGIQYPKSYRLTFIFEHT
ncbi:hypothetical protein Tco_0812692 [Tanacetum coccineum]